jgi:branched-chain amino acid aminotransferase
MLQISSLFRNERTAESSFSANGRKSGFSSMSLLTYDDRDGVIWFNGSLIPWREAKLHVLSHGLHYASCIFEGERSYRGKIFRLKEHTERLIESARLLGFRLPYASDEIDVACNEVLAASGLSEAYVRPVAWRGSEMMGVSAQQSSIQMAIAVWEWPSYFDPEERLKGIRLDISSWRRPSPETVPCHAKAAGLYMICTLSKHDAEAKGYADALMYDYRGQVAEATGANVFFVRDGVLHTPVPDCFLDGITRRSVIELARLRRFDVVERAIFPNELADFSECFITGTAAEVTPVSEIGPHKFKPGAITKTLMDDYECLVNGIDMVNQEKSATA